MTYEVIAMPLEFGAVQRIITLLALLLVTGALGVFGAEAQTI